MIIAVDFDGTIVEHKYPEIGREMPFAIDTLLRIQSELHHQIILWTSRNGEHLNEAVEFCRKRGLEFYAVNANFAEDDGEDRHLSRKVKADLFIDDCNIGGIPDWGIIYQLIKTGHHQDGILDGEEQQYARHGRSRRRKNIFTRIGEWLDGK